MPNKTNQYIASSFFLVAVIAVLGWYFYSTTKIVVPEVSSVQPARVDVVNKTDFDSLLQGRVNPVPVSNQSGGIAEKIDVGRADPFEPY